MAKDKTHLDIFMHCDVVWVDHLVVRKVSALPQYTRALCSRQVTCVSELWLIPLDVMRFQVQVMFPQKDQGQIKTWRVWVKLSKHVHGAYHW